MIHKALRESLVFGIIKDLIGHVVVKAVDRKFIKTDFFSRDLYKTDRALSLHLLRKYQIFLIIYLSVLWSASFRWIFPTRPENMQPCNDRDRVLSIV